MDDMSDEENIPVPPISSTQFHPVAQVLQLLNVGAEFSHQRDQQKRAKDGLKETPSLIQACFRYIGKHSDQMKNTQFNVPEEISNELLAYLIQNKCLNKHNLNLVLSNESSSPKNLSLSRYGGLPEDAIQQIAIATSLQGLSLQGCFCVSDATIQIIAQGCTSLTSLDISDLPRITSASLNHITLYCTNLKTLNAKRCMNISGAIDWKSNSITTLGLGGTKVTSLTLSAPLEVVDCADCSYLTHLDWPNHDHVTLQFINLFLCKALQNHLNFLTIVGPKLLKLNMFECENLIPGNFEILSERLINIESLTLSNNNFLVDSDLKGISQNCKKLKNLFVNSCDHVTDEGMMYVANLQELETISFPKVSDRPIVEIATRENKLQTIDICQNRNVHNEGPRAILKNCKRLFALSLAGCRFITDDAFSEISENLDSLQNLNLMNVTQLTDLAMRTIGEKFKNLSALDLYKNANVTDTGISHILIGCGNSLKRLYLQYCIMVGDETLGNIGKMCPNLEYLDVYGNNRVTIEGLKLVLKNNLELKELNVDNKLRDEAMAFITVKKITGE